MAWHSPSWRAAPSSTRAWFWCPRAGGLPGQLHAAGVTVVVIEQAAAHAMRHARTMTVLDRGTVGYCGSVTDASAAEALPKVNSIYQQETSNA